MSAAVPDRTIACPGVSWRARKGGTSTTTGGWQDKEPRGAAVGGALGVLAMALLPATMFALMTGVITLTRLFGRGDDTGEARTAGTVIVWAMIASLAIGAVALGCVSRLAERAAAPLLPLREKVVRRAG